MARKEGDASGAESDSPARAQQAKRSRRHKSEKSIFPQKLWRMVNDQRLNMAIRWTEDGQSFLIQENELKIKCLGKENHLFYTRQPKSFVRQLHLYGFRKINKNQFSHSCFIREQPQLLEYIKRTYKPIPNALRDTAKSNSQRNQMIEPNLNASHDANQEAPDALASLKVEHNQVPANCAQEGHYEIDLEMGRTSTAVTAFNDSGIDSINNFTDHKPRPTVGALAYPNNFDEDCLQPSIGWYERNYVDNNYSYNEDSILTLYNNDIYPNTCDDNNITL